MKQNINIEAEGNELVLKNKAGDYVIIPKKYRREVQDMIKEGCHGCIDKLVDTLPVMEDYAQDGSLIPDDKKKITFEYKPYTAVQDNTYVAPKVIIPLEQKKKQQFIPREQPILKADTRTEQERNIAQKYTEAVLNPSISIQIGEAFQKPLRWLADPVKGVGDIVSAVAPNSALAKDLPNTNEETFEYRKKQLNPYTFNKEKINNTINEAIPLTSWALLNTLPVEAAAGNMIKSGKNLIKPVSKVVNKTDDVVNIGNKSWKKYITQEEKVDRMLAQKDKIKNATLPENQLSLEEKMNPFKVEDIGGGDDYKDIINLSKGDRRHNPGMTYDEFENAAKTWASKRNDDLAPDMGSLGSARHNDYWGISKDFKGLPEDADFVRKFAYNKYYGSGTPEQKLIVENAIKNHELDHFLYKNSRKEYDDIIKAFNPEKFGVDARYLKGRKSSIAGDEIRARMAQLMDYFEFKVNPKSGLVEDAFGNKAFTQKHLDYARKNYIKDTNLDNSMSSFFNGIVDDKKFIKIMNNTALGTIPIMIYLQSQNQNKLGQ